MSRDNPSEGGGQERRKTRFPRRVYGVGVEPDPRFSLANERTFLAWIRTSLALVAAGVALEALGFPQSPGLRGAAAVIFILLGTGAAVRAWIGWMAAERALRRNVPLPAPSLALVMVVGTVAGVLLVALGSFV
jgi:putative membrane protein